MEALLGRVRDAMNVSPTEAQYVYYEIANSKYRQALMEVLVERKEFIRAQLDPTLYETQTPSNQINQVLRLLDNPVLPISPDEERDEEAEKMEGMYVEKMRELRSLLHSNLLELRQGCEQIKADFCRVLKNQQMLRPIDHQDLNRALESIRWKQEIAEIETKQTIANSVMLVQTKIIEATKRRRNFSKEAVAILQEYYDSHLAHPYPTEREKIRLAEKCHISVQQVANWFGNRRIRTKKTQRQLLSNPDQNGLYAQSRAQIPLNGEEYVLNNKDSSTCDGAPGYEHIP